MSSVRGLAIQTLLKQKKGLRVLITGSSGFIGRNLAKVLTDRDHQVVEDPSDFSVCKMGKDACVYDNHVNRWAQYLVEKNVSVVVHNAAVVGTDVVSLYMKEATLTNVTGTENIVRACEAANVPICYMGTSVVYQTEIYQDEVITEESRILPKTYYGVTKLAGDMIVKRAKVPASIVRPLFAYGGLGDMNSLVAKTLFTSYHRDVGTVVPMFLDPTKVKDYIHVSDFCEAVSIVLEKGLWGEDFIVSQQDPRPVSEIMELIENQCSPFHLPNQFLKWHPETDYLGNHRLSSEKFRRVTGWSPKVTLDAGIAQVAQEMLRLQDNTYDPLQHLESASKHGIDLTKSY
jgi:dTDP-glucose 4,6-dehydratase